MKFKRTLKLFLVTFCILFVLVPLAIAEETGSFQVVHKDGTTDKGESQDSDNKNINGLEVSNVLDPKGGYDEVTGNKNTSVAWDKIRKWGSFALFGAVVYFFGRSGFTFFTSNDTDKKSEAFTDLFKGVIFLIAFFVCLGTSLGSFSWWQF